MDPLLSTLLLLASLLYPGEDLSPVRHAGIELGGRGVKATILEVAGGVYRRVYSKTTNTTLSTLDARGAFRQAAIDEAVKAIADFHTTFRTTYKVPPERIYLVGSSGVPTASNSEDFLAAVKKVTGKEMTFIDEKTEVALTIAGVIPREERDSALSLDIGGGNTKGGYMSIGKPLLYVAIPLGSVTFTEKVRTRATQSGQSLLDAATALRESELLKPLRAGANAMPDLPQRKKVYLSGGIIWAMITILHPEAIDDPLVTIKAGDIEKFRKLLRTSKTFPSVNLASIREPGQRGRAETELKTVSKVYPLDNLQASAEILASMAEAFKFDQRTVVFPRNASFGWLAAYVAGGKGK